MSTSDSSASRPSPATAPDASAPDGGLATRGAPSARTRLWVIALVACATLLYEILLTRICSLRLAFHYSFLIVSNGMLGMGAAGSLVYLLRGRLRVDDERTLRRMLWVFGLSLPLTWLWLVRFPIDPDLRVSESALSPTFLAFNAGAALPFLTGGLVIAMLLSVHARAVHRFYAADLVGAALGCALCPLLLWVTGAGGAAASATALSFAAIALAGGGGGARRVATAACVLALACIPFLDDAFPVPSANEVRLSRGERIQLGSEKVLSKWSALSRIDVYGLDEDERTIFLRGREARAHPEEQLFIAQDGSAGTFMHDFSGTPEGLETLSRTLYSAATTLFGSRRVLIIGAGGGADLWAVRAAGAQRVKAFELNRSIVELHTRHFADFSRDLLSDPGVELVNAEGRSGLLRETERWDLVQMSAIDTWSALTSGAYMLAENYLYTVDAIRDMLSVLDEDGALQVTRLSGDVEVLRLLVIIEEAWRARGRGDFADCVICLQTGDYMAVLTRLEPITPEQSERLAAWLEHSGVDLVYSPGTKLGGVVEAFLRAPDRSAFVAGSPVNLSPTTDDKPYFFNFTRWDDIDEAKRTIDAPVSVVQGNPAMLFAQLGFSGLASVLLLGAPLFWLRARRGRAPLVASLGYFLSLGFGFIAIEIALMQKLVLLVGHPLYSVTVSLAGILLFTGVGSWLSSRRFARPTRAFWIVPIGIALWVALFAWTGDEWIRAGVKLPQVARFGLALAWIAPLAVLLGIPFAHGAALLERSSPDLVPWAWAVNAAGTVVGAIATAIASMNFGFQAVMIGAAALYFVAALCVGPMRRAVASG